MLYPDSLLIQHCQLFLDIRASSILQTLLSSNDIVTKTTLLKSCVRILSICYSLESSVKHESLFKSLSDEFTSASWIQGLSFILRDKHVQVNSEAFLLCLQYLLLMSSCNHWMRYWIECDILTLLINCKRRLDGHLELATCRKTVDNIIRQIVVNKSSYINATIALRLFSSNVENKFVTSFITDKPSTVHSLLIDATDLSFGSTLSEQIKFTDQLFQWYRDVFPLTNTLDRNNNEQNNKNISNPESFWTASLELVEQISSWICTLALPLEVEERDKTKRDKHRTISGVIVQQISIIECIISHAMCSKDSSRALQTLTTVLWSKSATITNDDQTIKNPPTFDDDNISIPSPRLSESNGSVLHQKGQPKVYSENGLLTCLRHLMVTNIISDNFDTCKVQLQIVSTVIRLLSFCSSSDIESLCDMGIIYSLMQFVTETFKLMKNIIPRSAYHGPFIKVHLPLMYTIRNIFNTLLSISFPPIVHEHIIDSGVMQFIIEYCIGDMSILHIHGQSSSSVSSLEIDNLILRYESLNILRIVQQRKDTCEKIMYHISELLISNNIINKEIMKLKSSNNKKGDKLSKSSAVAILAVLAEYNSEKIDSKLEVSASFIYLLFFALFIYLMDIYLGGRSSFYYSSSMFETGIESSFCDSIVDEMVSIPIRSIGVIE